MIPTPVSFRFKPLVAVLTRTGGLQPRFGGLQRRCNGIPPPAQTP